MTGAARLALERRSDVPIARIEGQIDTASAPALRREILANLPNTAYGLVVDLSPTTYLDSAGVKLLFEVAERLNDRQQELCAVVPEGARIRRVLDLVDLESVISVETELAPAVDRIAALGGAGEP